jgi:hypothetical protein
MASRNRGKSKVSLRDLSRIQPTDEERREVRQALARESPIATAILGASVVEYELEAELRARFRRSDDEAWKLLTGDNGPLGTFSQKILAAYGFGIADATIKDAMDTIRQIRNAFAHTKKLIDFENEIVVRELRAVSLPKAKRSVLYKDLFDVREFRGDPRIAYASLCLVVGMNLLDKRIKRAEAKTARLHARLRRQQFANALHQPPALRQAGLLGLLGGYRSADPTKTILGSIPLGGFDWGPPAMTKRTTEGEVNHSRQVVLFAIRRPVTRIVILVIISRQ